MLYVLYVPTFGKVSTDWSQNYHAMQRPLGTAAGEGFDNRKDVDIAEKRNEGIRRAIDSGAKVIIFIGDDVHCPIETIQQLLKRWREGAKAVTGVYWTKSAVPEPYIWRGYMEGAFFDWKVGDYIEVDWAGCDCLLLDVATLKKIEAPWFSLSYDMAKANHSAPSRTWRPGINTEDLYFYSKMKEAGVKLMCDTAIQCYHEDRNTGQLYGLVDGMPQKRREPSEITGKLIADIGCGAGVNPLYQENTVHRFDLDESCKPDYVCDVRSLPVNSEVYDIAIASHVLEHLRLNETGPALKEWARILKVGGQLIVRVPNISYAAKVIANDGPFTVDPRWPDYPYELLMLYGSQDAEGMFHQSGFTKMFLQNLVNTWLGESFESEVSETCGGSELTLTAIKKVAASTPRKVADFFMPHIDSPAPIVELAAAPPETNGKVLLKEELSESIS